jgi:hypothetical protein
MDRIRFVLVGLLIVLALSACAGLPVTGPGTPVVQPTETQSPVIVEPATPEPVVTQAPLDGEAFDQALGDALEARDLNQLQALMGSRFLLGGWRSEGSEYSPAEAASELGAGALGAGSSPQVDFSADTAALLGGADPLAFFGPDAVRAFFMQGLGAQGADEGIAIVGRDPASGELYFRGLLVAFMGFPAEEPVGDLGEFSQQLAAAIEGRDFATLRGLMADPFSFLTWNNQLNAIPADEAIARLQAGPLAEGSQPSLRPGTDVVALLEGSHPFEVWGPVAEIVQATHIMGLGANANQEAVVVIGRDPASGEFTFHGILLPPDGFFHSGGSGSADPDAVIATDVRAIMAVEAVNLRSGPGLEFAVEGMLRNGQTGVVTGKSGDGAWWQIECVTDSSGRCWVSADPAYTTPIANP